MSIIFRSVPLPDQFALLLRSNMQSGGRKEESLPEIFNKSMQLKYLVKNTFNIENSKIDIWSVIKNIGWIGLRNRIASVYMFYMKHGYYPSEYSLSEIKELEDFENRTKSYQVDGHSRVFLLGMFLKGQEMYSGSEWFAAFNDKRLLACLDLSHAKIVKLDWVLLMLFHFKLFLGMEELIVKLTNQESFEDIYQSLDIDEQRVYQSNLLAYGHSIGELATFFNVTV